MRGFFIFILMIIGIGLLGRTVLEIQKQKRYSFKNAAILKKQKVTLLMGAVGAVLFIVTFWIMLY